MIALAATCLLVAAPARGSGFTRRGSPGATPFLSLTGARPLAAAIGPWRVRAHDARRLADAGLVRVAEPERRLVPDPRSIDPLPGDEWWLAAVGATNVPATGLGVPVAIVDTWLDFTHPEFEQRPDTTSLNAQKVVDTLGDFHGTAVASIVGAFRSGALIVAAAGNSGASDVLSYPPNLPHVLTVAAMTQTGQPAPFSSISDGVDLAAPGVGDHRGGAVHLHDRRLLLDGTSFSAPIVSGAALGLDGSQRPRQHPTVRPASVLGARHRAARLRTRHGISGCWTFRARSPARRRIGTRRSRMPTCASSSRTASSTTANRRFSRAQSSACVRGPVDRSEDPDDLYRVWLPGRHMLTAWANNSSVRLRLWRPATRTVTESSTAAARDLLTSGTGHVETSNAAETGARTTTTTSATRATSATYAIS